MVATRGASIKAETSRKELGECPAARSQDTEGLCPCGSESLHACDELFDCEQCYWHADGSGQLMTLLL